jgi:hypothetical protein
MTQMTTVISAPDRDEEYTTHCTTGLIVADAALLVRRILTVETKIEWMSHP